MKEYKLYCMDGTPPHIVSAHDLVAQDDLDALQEAEKICQENDVEIWQGARRVARVKKGNDPLNLSDRLAL